jgi:hypothetical protein
VPILSSLILSAAAAFVVGVVCAWGLGALAGRGAFGPTGAPSFARVSAAWVVGGAGLTALAVWRVRAQQRALGFTEEVIAAQAPFSEAGLALMCVSAVGLVTYTVFRRLRDSALPADHAGTSLATGSPGPVIARSPILAGGWAFLGGILLALVVVALGDLAALARR